MGRKKKQERVDIFDPFIDCVFPCQVIAIGQPNRPEIFEGDVYTAIDKAGCNLVILTHDKREVFFNKKWFEVYNNQNN